MKFYGKTVLVYGYGKSGVSASELLLRNGARVLVWDDDKDALALVSEKSGAVRMCAAELAGVDLVVVSPGVPFDTPMLLEARLRGIRVISEIELGFTFSDAELIAVTGTNGKTTVSMLIYAMLKEAGRAVKLLGNSGNPFCNEAEALTENTTAVVEASSFQLRGIRHFAPDIAVFLNLEEDHLDYHKDFWEYAGAKLRIFENQSESDAAVINDDDKRLRELTENLKARKIRFGSTARSDAYALDDGVFYKGERLFDVASIRLRGAHNLSNVLAATAVAMESGVHPCAIKRAVENFLPARYRNEFIGTAGNKKIFNDSKGTNVASTVTAARAAEGETVLILGGSDKGEDFSRLFASLPKNVIYAVVTGDNAPSVIEGALKAGFLKLSHRATLFDALEYAVSLPVKNVLFSPASASFDRYVSYAERGEDFSRLASGLKDFVPSGLPVYDGDAH
ncbi:MAG: UDP-N-acetylmuramoyl-L-alanine--D-glutamate ligase [Clostridiaceae bacterium]|jgi:UDP-N-acetylmuramoylalanine--D-glutamate ligase|nr:UDP-N-acetylmuramoyl-L-alanine--D-glutamate ligase [Clostridiaceae bacterium]